MATKDLESMSLDEIIEHRLALKHKKEDILKELTLGRETYDRKVAAFHMGEAITQISKAAEKNGLPLDEQAKQWLNDGQLGHEVQARLYLGMPRVGRG